MLNLQTGGRRTVVISLLQYQEMPATTPKHWACPLCSPAPVVQDPQSAKTPKLVDP